MSHAALPVSYDMRPCPFCGGARVRLHAYRSHGVHHLVLCLTPDCAARGPRRYDAASAMDAWNERGAL